MNILAPLQLTDWYIMVRERNTPGLFNFNNISSYITINLTLIYAKSKIWDLMIGCNVHQVKVNNDVHWSMTLPPLSLLQCCDLWTPIGPVAWEAFVNLLWPRIYGFLIRFPGIDEHLQPGIQLSFGLYISITDVVWQTLTSGTFWGVRVLWFIHGYQSISVMCECLLINKVQLPLK